MIIVAVVSEIMLFNSDGEGPIANIGFSFQWISIKKLSPPRAAKIICDAYDEAVEIAISQKCPFKVGDTVVYRPTHHGRGWLLHTDLEALKP